MNYSVFLNEAIQSIATLRSTQIELRPGQILQGTIIKQLPGQLATVQLGGMLITARLEAALEDGQKVWLQVQPERNPITLRLIEKPETRAMSAQSNKIPAGPSIQDLSTAFQVSLNKEQASFLQSLIEQKVPINTELIHDLPNLINQFGATKELANALETIGNKNLPLTNDTISAVQAFQQNKGYANQIDQILQRLVEYSQAQNSKQQQNLNQQRNTDQVTAQKNPIQNLIQQLHKNNEIIHQLDQQIKDLFQAHEDSILSKSPESPVSPGVPSESVSNLGIKQPIAPESDTGLQYNTKTVSNTKEDHNPTIVNQNQDVQLQNQTHNQVQTQSQAQALNQTQTQNQNSTLAHLAEPPTAQKAGQLITNLFQQLGIQYEHQLSQSSALTHTDTLHHLNTIKAAIFQVLQSPDADSMPQSLKQDLGHLADHITGQQLMATDYNTANPFIQFSMQIPLPGLNQDQNAFIHIESRKKGKSSIDQENCRLFFYLTMQHLGETALDVSIVNKILSVTFYNDHPWVPNFIQPLRKDLETHLLKQGYTLSNFKIVELPKKKESFIQSPPDSMKNYKGVNLRI